jgi:hypothetical protein
VTHFHVAIPENAEPTLNDYEQLAQVKWVTRKEAEQAFETLDPAAAQKALGFVDEVLSHDAQAAPSRPPTRVSCAPRTPTVAPSFTRPVRLPFLHSE